MQLEHADIIEAPREAVYSLIKERLPELVPYLPSIDRIEQTEFQKTDSGAHVVNHWHAKPEVPSMLRKVLSEELFAWKDIAEWDDKAYTVRYALKPFIETAVFSAEGANYFESDSENTTKLRVTCDVAIHPERVPGVPKLMARTAKPALEKLIAKMLQPNLTTLGDGLRRYFLENAAQNEPIR